MPRPGARRERQRNRTRPHPAEGVQGDDPPDQAEGQAGRIAFRRQCVQCQGESSRNRRFLGKYIPAVEQMHTTLKKYNTAFTVTTAENKKLKKKTEQLEQSLDKATQESTLKKLADAKLHRDYEDAVAVLDCILNEVLAAYAHKAEKERETAYGR